MVAENFTAKVGEKVPGHDDRDRAAKNGLSKPERDGEKYADPSGEKMKALAWEAKNKVRDSKYTTLSALPRTYD